MLILPQTLMQKKVYKDTFKDKLMKFVIEHSDDLIMSLDEFERLSSGWDLGRRIVREWYLVYKDLYYKQPVKIFKYLNLRGAALVNSKPKRMRKIKSDSVKNSF